MDTGDFARGFERDPSEYAHLPPKEWRHARDALIDPAVRWSHFFSQVVENYFMDDIEDVGDVKKNIRLYSSTTNRHMLHNIDETAQGIAFHRPEMVRQINPLNFHTMNQEMRPYWMRLVDPELHNAPDYIDLSVMQTKLAIQALRLVESRREFYAKTLILNPQPAKEDLRLDDSLVGRITEIDAAITLLEVVKQQPIDEVDNLVVIPGPPKYEGFGDKASDFLLIDPQRRQAHGVQVKTRVWQQGQYDPRYVSMIDGRNDLGNVAYESTSGTYTKRQAAPGLIAADFMLNSEGLQRHSSFSRIVGLRGLFGSILHSKDIARSMAEDIDYTDRASYAAAQIGPRLMAALYNDTFEDTPIE